MRVKAFDDQRCNAMHTGRTRNVRDDNYHALVWMDDFFKLRRSDRSVQCFVQLRISQRLCGDIVRSEYLKTIRIKIKWNFTRAVSECDGGGTQFLLQIAAARLFALY